MDVGVESDFRDGENSQAAFERVYNFVAEKLMEKLEEVENDIKAMKGKG